MDKFPLNPRNQVMRVQLTDTEYEWLEKIAELMGKKPEQVFAVMARQGMLHFLEVSSTAHLDISHKLHTVIDLVSHDPTTT